MSKYQILILLSLSLLVIGPASAKNYDGGGCPESLIDTRDVVRDESDGTIVHSSSGECVRTQWDAGYDACRQGPVSLRTNVSLSREDRTVYFGFNQASLSPEMKDRLDTLATTLRSQQNVRGVRIFGYADRIGSPSYNERLSKKRAETVRHYLAVRGLINMRVTETKWFGATEPATNCPADISREELISCLQKDRRVEVEIDYTP